MPTVKINFKSINLNVGNKYELNISAECWQSTTKIGQANIIVDMRGKTMAQIKDEAKDVLKARARYLLENMEPVYNIPDSVPNFSADVEYEEK